MSEIPDVGSYRRGKRKRVMINLLSNIEGYLGRVVNLTNNLDVFLQDWEESGLLEEMTDNMSSEEKRRLQALFESIEFMIRRSKNRIIVPAHCRRKPPLK